METLFEALHNLESDADRPEAKPAKSDDKPVATPASGYRDIHYSILLFIALDLAALGLSCYALLHTPVMPGVFLAGLLVLLAVVFGTTMASVIARLKKCEQVAREDAEDMKKAHANLEIAERQIGNINFQLNNANLQFDIITSELESAKRETDTIFSTVRQGLFLLDPDGTISAQTSAELKNIFQSDALARRNFAQLLRPLLPEKRNQTVSDYLELLFNPRKNDKQLAKFNPLKRVELNFPRAEGGFQSKHVEFMFQRIMAGGKVERVMVTVLDITERVKLEDQLRAGEVMREKQLELLFEILQVESGQLRSFIDEAKSGLDQINGIFMEQSPSGAAITLQEKVQRVFRLVHNLKSRAASLGLHLFEKTVHKIEDQLNDLRRNPSLANEDLLPVLVSIANFQTQLGDTSELIEKVANLRHSFTPGSTPAPGNAEVQRPAVQSTHTVQGAVVSRTLPIMTKPSDELKKSTEDLCSTVASRTGKKVKLEWKLGSYDTLPAGHRRVLRNAIFQLVRNSVVHGIELPAERARAGKDPCGCVTIAITRIPVKKQVLVVCRDDGAGLDAESIRRHAVKEKIIHDSEANQLSENDLCGLIFEPGFSTASAVTEDGGRGVGLDVVRSEIVDELHGEIHIEFCAGRFCEFGLTVPAA